MPVRYANRSERLKQRAEIHITGVVQGVGFRPFVYGLAKEFSLLGYVLNLGNAGVLMVLEGRRRDIETLIHELRSRAPPISRIDAIDVEWGDATDQFKEFTIERSVDSKKETPGLDMPPDVAMCEDCVTDLLTPRSRWHLYPFTSCSICGPRFSTITSLPYDRPNTTMDDFPLCNTCNTEYHDPTNRRYYAQTIACPECGPSYRLLNASGKVAEVSEPIATAAKSVKSGKIGAFQGISGTHLVTMTSKPKAIRELRERKKRLFRPFAIMVRDLETLRNQFSVSSQEIASLSSWERPIVLVKKRDSSGKTERDSSTAPEIADDCLDLISPGLDTVGVMLPYSGLHHLLFHYLDEPALVMTSANPTGVPMYIDPDVIVTELKGIADLFLVHNRRIEQRADDSVIKFLVSGPVFIRRARGYVPGPIAVNGLSTETKVIAVGPEERATGAVLRMGRVYQTQHIGDTNRTENVDFLWDALSHIMKVLALTSYDAVACDLHPEFLSTEFARKIAAEQGVPVFPVQHHHAHLAALLADSGLPVDTTIACITIDGFGYAPGGESWGGDVLVGDALETSRAGGLKRQTFLGGDLSAIYSARALLGILGDSVDSSDISYLLGKAQIAPGVLATSSNLSILSEMRLRRVNLLQSTSAGRFLDAVSAALGLCFENSYDGECPMKLEAVARETDLRIKEYNLERSTELDTTEPIREVLRLKRERFPTMDIAYAAQWYLGESLAALACAVSKEKGLKFVGVSGGVAVNRIVMQAIAKQVEREGLKLLAHRNVPPGDGGVSVGQVVVSTSRLNR
jgi:hydrogenase maturation protein HypF